MSRAPRKETVRELPTEFGKTIQRLRQAYNLSLGQLSEQSGVAKSIIAAIEKNETNPTLSTIWRLSEALNTSVDAVLGGPSSAPAMIEHVRVQDTPLLTSQDGLCSLRIVGALDIVQFVQWYEFRAAPGGRLESDPHPKGSVENLSIISGQVAVTVDGETEIAAAGETLRYRGDAPHSIANIGEEPVLAFMVNILKGAGAFGSD